MLEIVLALKKLKFKLDSAVTVSKAKVTCCLTYLFLFALAGGVIEQVLSEVFFGLEGLGLESVSQALGEHQRDVLLAQVLHIWVNTVQQLIIVIHESVCVRLGHLVGKV